MIKAPGSNIVVASLKDKAPRGLRSFMWGLVGMQKLDSVGLGEGEAPYQHSSKFIRVHPKG